MLREAVAFGLRAAVQHLPPRRRGLGAVALVERVVPPPSKPLRAKHLSGFHVTCDLSDSVQRSLFYKGTMEERATAKLLSVLRAGDVVLDVGANAGHFSFLAASRIGPQGHVHAIEANPRMASTLLEDVVANGLTDRITVHSIGVSDRPGSFTLSEAPGESPVGQRFLDPSGTSKGDVVEVTTLDTLLPDVAFDVVKIDVEGADLSVLRGMTRALERRLPRLLLVEAIDEQLARFGDSVATLLEFMQSYGYEAEDVSEVGGASELAFSLGSSH